MKRKTHKLTSVPVPSCDKKVERLVTISMKKQKRPALGLTLTRLTGSYSLDALYKLAKKNPDKGLVDEIYKLQKQIYNCSSITDFLKKFHTRHGEPQNNSELKKEMNRIKHIFDQEFDETIIHIHTKPLGKGKFVLFGFVSHDVFEVLLLDPEHKIVE